MEIEGIPELTLENEHFIWEGNAVPYASVEQIAFHATQTRHSYNAIPTGTEYASKLELEIKDARPIEITFSGRGLINHDSERQGMKRLWQVRELLCELTFLHRIKRYEDQFADKGYFGYFAYRFHRDGDISKHGKRLFNIKDRGFAAQMSPFKLHLCGKRAGLAGFFNGDEIIELHVDEDCVLYMLRAAYGWTWQSHPVRKKRRIIVSDEPA